MCKPKAPKVDEEAIRRQEEEAKRQRDEDIARQERIHQEQLAEAERQRQETARLNAERVAQEQAYQAEQTRIAQEQAAREAAERAAAEAAAQERAGQVSAYNSGRQQRLSDITDDINAAFGGFNTAYYNKFVKDFIGYYQPQIAEQFDDANRQATFSFANAGSLESSAFNRQAAQLQEKRAAEEARIANEASQQSAKLRADVDSARSALLGQARSAAYIGPEDAPTGWDAINGTLKGIDSSLGNLRSSAATAAAGLKAPTTYQALGDVFKSLLTTPGAASAGTAKSNTQQAGTFVASLGDQGMRVVGG